MNFLYLPFVYGCMLGFHITLIACPTCFTEKKNRQQSLFFSKNTSYAINRTGQHKNAHHNKKHLMLAEAFKQLREKK